MGPLSTLALFPSGRHSVYFGSRPCAPVHRFALIPTCVPTSFLPTFLSLSLVSLISQDTRYLCTLCLAQVTPCYPPHLSLFSLSLLSLFSLSLSLPLFLSPLLQSLQSWGSEDWAIYIGRVWPLRGCRGLREGLSGPERDRAWECEHFQIPKAPVVSAWAAVVHPSQSLRQRMGDPHWLAGGDGGQQMLESPGSTDPLGSRLTAWWKEGQQLPVGGSGGSAP